MASFAPSPNDDAFADRRAHPRVSVALPAFLQVDGQRHSVQVLDLSAGGAKLDGPVAIAAGASVTLDCGTFGRTAIVRWQNGAVVGVSFDSELDDRELAALLERSNALSALMNTRG